MIYQDGFYPSPIVVFSANSLKLRAVLGTVPENKPEKWFVWEWNYGWIATLLLLPISIRPAGSPPIVMSKKTY